MNKNENWDSMPMWGTATDIHADQSPLTLQEARQRLASIQCRRPTLPMIGNQKLSLKAQRQYDKDYAKEVKILKSFVRSAETAGNNIWSQLLKTLAHKKCDGCKNCQCHKKENEKKPCSNPHCRCGTKPN